MASLPVSDPAVVSAEHVVLRAAVAAYLGRYRGETRLHTESDLRVFLRWCTDHDLDPLAAARVDVERYVRCCRTSAGTSRRRCPAACRSWSASTGSA
jgi:integrase/recombinase XerD